MPSAPLSAAAQLVAAGSRLGGASKTTPTPRTALPSGSVDFSSLLSQQLGGAENPSADPMSALSSLLGQSGGSADAGGGLGSLSAVSPQLAQAIARAQSAAPGGATAARTTTSRAQRAVTWAESHLGQESWNNLCERFVEEAYGTRDVFPTAADAGRAMTLHRGRGSWESAPVGALLYFAPDASNDHNGHAAIYLGNGRMISATPSGVQEESLDTPYYAERYMGWTDPAQLPAKASHARSTVRPAAVPATAASRIANPVPITRSSALLPNAAAARTLRPTGTAGVLPLASSPAGNAASRAVTPPSLPASIAPSRTGVTSPARPISALSSARPTSMGTPVTPGVPVSGAPLSATGSGVPANPLVGLATVPAPRRATPSVASLITPLPIPNAGR